MLTQKLPNVRHPELPLESHSVASRRLAPGDIAQLAEDEGFLTDARAAADQSLRKLMRILAEDGDRKAPLRPETQA